MTKVSFFTSGCRSNQAETAVLKGIFKHKGFTLAADDVPTEILVINSCTVTAESEREARRIINRSVRFNPNVRVAMTGCLAQVQTKKILSWPHVSWVVGNAKKMMLADIIQEDMGQGVARLVISPIQGI